MKTLPSRYGAPDPEKLDQTPVEMPMGATRPSPIHELIARMVREAVQNETGDEFESMEEADDFEEDDPDVMDMSAYEFDEIQEDYTPPLDPVEIPPEAPQEIIRDDSNGEPDQDPEEA